MPPGHYRRFPRAQQGAARGDAGRRAHEVREGSARGASTLKRPTRHAIMPRYAFEEPAARMPRAQKQAALSAPVNRVKAATCRRLGAREILCGEFPVEQFVDYRCDVIRALILIIEIIGMLPDVDRQQRSEALGQRQFGVGCLDDLERMPVGDEPSPTAAELLYGRVGELLLECVVAAERSIDLLGQRRAGLTATLWLQRMPIKVVIPGLRRVVEELGLVGLTRARHHDLFEALPLELGPLNQLVDLVDVGFMMFAVVEA